MFITSGHLITPANVVMRAMISGVKWIPLPDTADAVTSVDALAFFVGGSDDILICQERRTVNARIKPKVCAGYVRTRNVGDV